MLVKRTAISPACKYGCMPGNYFNYLTAGTVNLTLPSEATVAWAAVPTTGDVDVNVLAVPDAAQVPDATAPDVTVAL